MPLPNPNPGEQREEFISRCMADPIMLDDFPDQDQRLAVCNTQAEEPGQKAVSTENETFREKSDRLIAEIEQEFADDIEREKNRYISTSATEYAQAGRLEDSSFIQHRLNMGDINKRFARRAIGKYGRFIRDDIKKRVPKRKQYIVGQPMEVVETDAFFQKLTDTWFAMFAAEKVATASETTRLDIRKAILASQNQPIREIIKAIQNVKEISKTRSRTIARTETHNAATFASQNVAEQIELDAEEPVLKRWIPAEDERTRFSHATMANHPAIPLNTDFNVAGEKMSRPGDPRGSAGNVINCRCVLVYEFEE